jgi:hypothetical protein
MSKASVITPILVNVDNTLYKLLYINFGPDGSIYVYFPRKSGYKVTREVDLPNIIIRTQTFVLKNSQPDYKNPYISFHPKKKVIHINTQNGRIYKIDAEVINLAEDESNLLFSLCQIVFPTFSYLDIYTPSKHTSPYILSSKSINPNIDLCVEILVHPVNGYVDIAESPNFESRRKQTNIIGSAVFKNEKIHQYTCTLVVSEFIKKDETVTTPGITVLVLNEIRPYAFQLKPA